MAARRLGILCGGGPAPGMNSVISAATIEAINAGWSVVGIRNGFEHLIQGSTEKRDSGLNGKSATKREKMASAPTVVSQPSTAPTSNFLRCPRDSRWSGFTWRLRTRARGSAWPSMTRGG